MVKSYSDFRRKVPAHFFKPVAYRLIPVISVWLLGVASIVAMTQLEIHWAGKVGLGLFIGYCWSIGGLFAHELLHGSVIRSKKWQNFLSLFFLLPYGISPTFWRFWHNNLHHSHTQRAIFDPDAYPTLKIFKQSRFVQWMFPFSPGSGHKRSFSYFFFWFSFNVQVAQFYFRFRNKIYKKLDHKKVNRELCLAICLHVIFLFAVGPQNWLFAVVIPFMTMNYLPFSYISTNHNLSPLTKENDPLVNSLTVTNHPILEFFHINFGYHVEHHLFPTMSGKYLKKVHHMLKQEYPEKYIYMPKWKAMRELYRTARIYKNSNTLMNPETGSTYPVLGYQPPISTSQNNVVSETAEFNTVEAGVSNQPRSPEL